MKNPILLTLLMFGGLMTPPTRVKSLRPIKTIQLLLLKQFNLSNALVVTPLDRRACPFGRFTIG